VQPPVATPPAATAARPWSRRKRAVAAFLEHPVTDFTILALILVSVALLVVELAVADDQAAVLVLEVVNYVLTAVFTVELSLRFWVAKKKSRFFRRYWLDILALVPVIRPLRMLRVLRLLRLWRAGRLLNRRLQSVGGIFSAAVTELTTLVIVSAGIVLASAAVLYIGDPDTFPSIDESLWFAVLSLLAGEPIGVDPESEVARWGTLVLMLGGMIVMGTFIGTVSAGMGARLAKRLEDPEMDLDELEGHVVVCGWNGSAPMLVAELFAPGTPKDRAVIVVTEGPRPDDWPAAGVPIERLFHASGDWTRLEVLESVGIRAASTCVLLRDVMQPRSDQDRDARTVLAALTIEMVNPEIYTVAELHSPQSEKMLKLRGVEEVVVGELYAGMILGSAARNPGLVALLEDILDMRGGNSFWSCTIPERLDGSTVAELRRELHDRHDATLMSVEPASGPGVRVNPPDELQVRQGDVVIVVARGEIRW
jgi:voltage-gated potassium channel